MYNGRSVARKELLCNRVNLQYCVFSLYNKMSDHSSKNVKGTQVKGKSKGQGPCPRLCSLMPTNVPRPGPAQEVLHPRKDVFVLKVAKVGATGDRRCKMELELVTPKGMEKKAPGRVDTRETQCEPDPPPCCCMKQRKKIK